MKHELNPHEMSTNIQLVWNLADPAPSASQQNQRLQQFASGNHLSVALRRSLAPAKASSQLGAKVSVLTISEKEKKVLADPYAFIDEEDEPAFEPTLSSPDEVELAAESDTDSEDSSDEKATDFSNLQNV